MSGKTGRSTVDRRSILDESNAPDAEKRDSKRLPSYLDRLVTGEIDRPHYGYCIYQAAKLARLLKYPEISVIEFGVGGGNGLLNAEMHIREVMNIFPVEIELYGFDSGAGLPPPQDYRDMPHYFRRGLYRMDQHALERRLTKAKLVIGDVKVTSATFFNEHTPAPIGCMLHDLDFYSATKDTFTMFNADSSYFLPRIFNYFDDILGDDVWLCNDFSGERLAIEEFNLEHRTKKFSKCYHLPLMYPKFWWPHQIYVYHDFEHPRYNDFISTAQQLYHEVSIKLR
jgi:hypothetical protein